MTRIDFADINRMALVHLPTLLSRWLPNGRCEGREGRRLQPDAD